MQVRAPPAAPRRPAAPSRRWAKYELVFSDRLLVTLVHPRTGLTREVLGVIYQVGSPTIGRAIGESRPLLAERGFPVPRRPGLRPRTLADVFAYAEAERHTARRRHRNPGPSPKAERPERAAFVSGKRKQNTIKITTISDEQGRILWCGRAGCSTRPRCAPGGHR
jgi:Helix-turn-helix of DDE superfamily endonuclease